MNKINLYLFEPNYSPNGHYDRYINYLKNIFNLNLKNNLTGDCDNQKIINKKMGISKIIFSLKMLLQYLKLYKHRNEYILITSQGNIVFWLIAIIILKNYSINIISCEAFKKKGLKKSIFELFINKARFVTFTDRYYRDRYYKKGLILHDRSYKLITINSIKNTNSIKILGHIHVGRNPIEFIKKNVEIYKIEIFGKIDPDMLKKFPKHKNLHINNEYLTEENYLKKIENSYIYLPVTSQYSDVMISGVFFDTIENGGIPIIGKHEIYEEFLNMNMAIDSDMLNFQNKCIHEKYNALVKKYNSETIYTVNLVKNN